MKVSAALAWFLLGVSLEAQDAAAGLPRVSGGVLSADGKPLAGAPVELTRFPTAYELAVAALAGHGTPRGALAVSADASGRFALTVPGPGVWQILVAPDGFVPVLFPLPGLIDDRELPSLTLSTDVGVELQVLDPAGEPLPGAVVHARAGEEEPSAGAGWRLAPRIAVAAGNGSVRLPRAQGETLAVRVISPVSSEPFEAGGERVALRLDGSRGCERRLLVRDAGGAPAAGVLARRISGAPIAVSGVDGELPVRISGGATEEIRLVAEDGASREVSLVACGEGPMPPVELERPKAAVGRVIDAQNRKPVGGAVVWFGQDPGRFALTGADGAFALTLPDASKATLIAVAPGYLEQRYQFPWPGARAAFSPTVSLYRAAALNGSVSTSAGEVVAGASIVALRTGARAGAFSPQDRVATASDEGGRFRLTGLMPLARYDLVVCKAALAPVALSFAAGDSAASTLQVQVSQGRELVGRVVDPGGMPVEGARASLFDLEGLAAAAGAYCPLRQEVATDPQGHFRLSRVAPSSVGLRITKTGFAPLELGGLEVAAGSGAMDLGALTLQPSVSLRGSVVERGGKPLPGASVIRLQSPTVLNAAAQGRPIRQLPPTATTKDDGSFVVPDLASGERVDLLIFRRGYQQSLLLNVPVTSAEPLRVELGRAVTVAGVVVDENAAGVAGARVHLRCSPRGLDSKKSTNITGPTSGSATTDRQGQFRLEDVAPCRAEVEVVAEGLFQEAPLTLPLDLEASRKPLTILLRTGAVLEGRVVSAPGEPVPDARVRAQSAAAVTEGEGRFRLTGLRPGTALVLAEHRHYARLTKQIEIEAGTNQLELTFEKGSEVAGALVGEHDAAVPAAMVILVSEVSDLVELRAVSGPDGRFVFPTVPRGEYTVRVEAEDYAAAEWPTGLTVGEKAVSDLVLRLRRGSRVSGRVIGLSPEELTGLKVVAGSDGDLWLAGSVNTFATVYEVDHLSPGSWVIRASVDDDARVASVRVLVGPGSEEQSADLVFGRGISLRGRVLFGEEPLPGAFVSLRGLDVSHERSVISDHKGDFLATDLPAGSYRVQLSSRTEGVTLSEDVTLVHDRELILQVDVSRISGVVLDVSSAEPIDEARVDLKRLSDLDAQQPVFLISQPTALDGSFLVPRVTPGKYKLTVWKSGYSTVNQEIEVGARQDLNDVRVFLEPTVGIDIAVEVADGRRPRVVTVAVLSESGEVLAMEGRLLDEQGRGRLETIPPGAPRLLVGAEGFAPQEVRARVPDSLVAVLLERAGTLKVTVPELMGSDQVARVAVVDHSGQALVGFGEYTTLAREWSIAGGQAVLAGLKPGRWTVHVVSPEGKRWSGEVMVAAGAEAELTLKGK